MCMGMNHRMCLTAGFASGSNDVVQQRLKKLDDEAEVLATQLDGARAALSKKPGDQDLRDLVQDLKKKDAGLDERRKALEAKLSGATHVDAWALLLACVCTAGACPRSWAATPV